MPLRFLTAGESHGPALTAILEGMPAGLAVDRDALDRAMARRQHGIGSGARMKIERDAARITGGVMNGLTTGAPIALTVVNRDHAAWAERDIPPMTVPRPGHADLSATVKYGYRDLRLALERASARETAARVAVGALCGQLLDAFGVTVGSYVVAIGTVEVELSPDVDFPARFTRAEASEVRCPDADGSARMCAAVGEAVRARDTLGGVFEVAALGAPPGLGSHVHWDRRLSSRLLGAVGSIPAVKGVEIGPAFATAGHRGTEVRDALGIEGDDLVRSGSHGGGIEGGISTGEPILIRAAMSPLSTTLTPRPSVDLATGCPSDTRFERSDVCAVPRAAVVGEAMVAFVLADALIEKLGGDSLDEMRPRLDTLRRNRLTELPMDNLPWRFGFSSPPSPPDPGHAR